MEEGASSPQTPYHTEKEHRAEIPPVLHLRVPAGLFRGRLTWSNEICDAWCVWRPFHRSVDLPEEPCWIQPLVCGMWRCMCNRWRWTSTSRVRGRPEPAAHKVQRSTGCLSWLAVCIFAHIYFLPLWSSLYLYAIWVPNLERSLCHLCLYC